MLEGLTLAWRLKGERLLRVVHQDRPYHHAADFRILSEALSMPPRLTRLSSREGFLTTSASEAVHTVAGSDNGVFGRVPVIDPAAGGSRLVRVLAAAPSQSVGSGFPLWLPVGYVSPPGPSLWRANRTWQSRPGPMRDQNVSVISLVVKYSRPFGASPESSRAEGVLLRKTQRLLTGACPC